MTGKGCVAAFGELAVAGTVLAVRVRAGARRNAVEREGAVLRVTTTAAPEAGRANAAVTRLLAEALGVAPSRLTLVRGARARDKLFRLD